MIKTIELTAGVESAVETVGGAHAVVTNRGDSTLYVSTSEGVTAGGDGVKAIDASTSDIVRNVGVYATREGVPDYYGTLYMLSEGDASIQLETVRNANFRLAQKGGGSDSGCGVVGSSSFYGYFEYANDYYVGTYEEGDE
jgi:hypothetical protein